MSRYVSLAVLFVIAFIACAMVELVLRWTAAGVSLTDTKGIGQVTLFVVIVPCLIVFAAPRGGGPAAFLALYRGKLGRALGGFAAMWVQAVVLMALAYALLGALGYVLWSESAWADFSGQILQRTIVALLVVVILAFTEEMIFRGFVLRHLRYKPTPAVTIAAVLIGSAIFSLSHLISYRDAWTFHDVGGLLFGLWLLGGLFAVTYIATGSIACSIGMHAGLLGFKVFLRRTDLLDYRPDVWWLGNSHDLRLAPLTWLIMIVIGVIVWSSRHALRRYFYIEPVVADWKTRQPIAASRPS